MADQLFFERFIWFDAQVRKGRHPSAAKLAEQFEISGKTAQRSIEYFRDRLNAPLEYDSSLKGYYYVDNSFELPLMKLSEGELMSLLISRKLLSEASTGRLGEELAAVAKKLGGLLSAHMPGSVDPEQAFSFRWNQFHPSDSINFKQVSTALLNSRCLSICYYSPNSSECTMRTIEPQHMVNYMGTWHVIAWCRMRGEWRDFLLSRMSMVIVDDELFVQHPQQEWKPHLTETFGIFQNAEYFDVTLRFSPERAKWVRGELWHPEQKEEILDDGYYQLTVPVSHHAEIMMQVLGHGSHVTVVEPEWLRKMVADEVGKMANSYN
jgi:predicted DNA-binding transcriptional regulator YafY